MRRIWLLLLFALLGAVLPGQTRLAALQLNDGTQVTGVVLRIDGDGILLRVGEDQRHFKPDEIRECTFTPLEPPAAPGAETAATTVPAQSGADDAATAPDAIASPDRGADPAAPAAGNLAGPDDPARTAVGYRARPRWARRLEAFDLRFPWLFPTRQLQWISLGIMLFALLSLAVHFSAKLAATDRLEFGRATLVALCMLAVAGAQLALLPDTSTALMAAAVGNLLFALLWFGLAYGLGVGASILALALLGIQGGIAYSLLLLVDATLRSIGNTTF